MEERHPGVDFSEDAFCKGFDRFDQNKDGKIDFKDIKRVVEKKVKNENLYVKS